MAYSYAYTMLLAWKLGGRTNATLLGEARRAFEQMHLGGMAGIDAGARGNDYEAADGAIGLVAQAELYNSTGSDEKEKKQRYLDGAFTTLQDWLPYVTTFQLSWGQSKGYLPTFLSINAMPGVYPAPFENSNSARYLARFLELVGEGEGDDKLSAPVANLLRMIIRYSSGMVRHCYPDKLPPALLSPLAHGAGASQKAFPNNRTMIVPVEDMNWDSRGPALSGTVGQEAYGAGGTADYALLAAKYGSSVAYPPAPSRPED